LLSKQEENENEDVVGNVKGNGMIEVFQGSMIVFWGQIERGERESALQHLEFL
jgi:hypothetical protein